MTLPSHFRRFRRGQLSLFRLSILANLLLLYLVVTNPRIVLDTDSTSRTTGYHPQWAFFQRDQPLGDGSRATEKEEISIPVDQCTLCNVDPGICQEFGVDRVRRAMANAPSSNRLKRVLARIKDGQPFTVGVLGGSVSRGHGLPGTQDLPIVNGKRLHHQAYAPDNLHLKVFNQLDARFPSRTGGSRLLGEGGKDRGLNGFVNEGIPATGTNYFSFCWGLHMPSDVDIIIIELAINDDFDVESMRSYEALVRSLLALPGKPAIINIHSFGLVFSQLASGGDMHLAVASYYDIPTISLGSALVHEIVSDPVAGNEWFVSDESAYVKSIPGRDGRHISIKGHRTLANLVNAYIDSQLCELGEESTLSMGPEPPLPRLGLTDRFNLSHSTPTLIPNCVSVNSDVDPLTPKTANGWSLMTEGDKNFIQATIPGSRVELAFTSPEGRGEVWLYYLRSARLGLGNTECSIDDDRSGTVVSAYWPRDESIGRSVLVGTGIKPGPHTLTCTLLENTADPGGGTEFRIIAVMR